MKSDCILGLKTMSQNEILMALENVLHHPNYESNDYTDMMQDIVKHKSLSSRQRQVVETHLKFNKELWW